MTAVYNGLTFELLGHASINIETDEEVVYIDPWGEKLNAEPNDADYILLTHDDFDHYDPDAIEAVAGPGVTIAAYEAIDTDELSYDVVRLPSSGEVSVNGLDVQTIPAYNEPDGNHVDEDGNPFHAVGEVVGLLFELAGTKIFYPSDTDFLEHHVDVEVDILIPPIGGHYTMNRTDAVEMARAIEPVLVFPVHYGTSEMTQTNVDAFISECKAAGIDAKIL